MQFAVIRTLARHVLRRKGVGCKPDVVDPRDRMAAALGLPTTPPPSADLTPWVLGLLDQGATNSCVAQAWTLALRICDARRGFALRLADSRLFHYWNSRALDGEPGIDDGTRLRSCAKAIIKYGRPPETIWPFSVLKVNRKPSIGAYRHGFDDRGNHGYYRVALADVDAVKRLLASGIPVLGGWAIDDGFGGYNGQGVVRPGGKSWGGHAMVLTGYYADGTFKLANSWGRKYGRDGYAIVDESFLRKGYDGWAASYS